MNRINHTSEGIVLSIQRCSLHDGPGIRTTVFLKGCPLTCLWCHNPESQSPRPQLQLPGSTCSLCGECIRVCPNGAHQIDVETMLHTLDPNRCTQCGACVRACPTATLTIAGTRMSVAEVMSEIQKDRAYYDESGGGVTFSGGEPFLQHAFTHELLRTCRSGGIHTCVETCGYVSQRRLVSVLPLIDLFLLDYKATGARLHRELTGVDAGVILRTLAILDEHGARVVLRCPMVPGVNDSPKHLRAIASIALKNRAVESVELMAYHDFARDKYRRIGRRYACPAPATTVDQPTSQRWVEAVREAGYEPVCVG